MLTNSRFWVGMVSGVIAYHLYMSYKARQSSS